MTPTSTRIRTIIDDLDKLISNDDGLALALLADAKDKLQSAYEANLYDEQEAARDRANDRRTMRAESGYPQ